MKELEILAPAGSMESLASALKSGCDSVFFGITQLNMRARSASNFDQNDLQVITQRCHQNKIKAYLALNSLMYQHDLKIMKKVLDHAKENKIDAVILADVAAIQYARKIGLSVHISTQLSVSNLETVEFWAYYADTIVLARELTLPMIKSITEAIKKYDIRGPSGKLLRIEIFAHGALCVAISGRCGMSLYTANASANRGACIQNCRKPYVVIDKETGMELEIDNEYVMSPRDICTIDFLDQIVDSGVSVLKLEGRGRAPEYVETVVRCYRQALDSIAKHTYTEEKIAQWLKELSSVYNRGLSDGYYLGQKQGSWSVSPNNQANMEKIYVGNVRHFYPKAQVMQVHIEAHILAKGSPILITGTTTGAVYDSVKEMRSQSDQTIETAAQNELITMPVASKVRPGDRIYIYRQKSGQPN